MDDLYIGKIHRITFYTKGVRYDMEQACKLCVDNLDKFKEMITDEKGTSCLTVGDKPFNVLFIVCGINKLGELLFAIKTSGKKHAYRRMTKDGEIKKVDGIIFQKLRFSPGRWDENRIKYAVGDFEFHDINRVMKNVYQDMQIEPIDNVKYHLDNDYALNYQRFMNHQGRMQPASNSGTMEFEKFLDEQGVVRKRLHKTEEYL